jgi:hypothetical protein
VGGSSSAIKPEGAAVTGGAVGVIAGAAAAFGYMVMTNRSQGVTPEVSEEEPSDDAHKLAHG